MMIPYKRGCLPVHVAIGLGFIVSACYKIDTSNSSQNDSANPSLEMYNVDVALCYWYDRCGTGQLRYYSDSSVDSCLDFTVCGLTTWHDSNYYCFTEILKLSCDENELNRLLFSAVCRPGTNELGEACDLFDLCKEGLICVKEGTDSDISFTCEKILGIGDTCANDNEEKNKPCDKTLFCNNETGLCEVKRSVGENCNKPEWCRTPNICSDDGICMPPAKEGEKCDEWLSCESGLYCDGAVCKTYQDEGEVCSNDSDSRKVCRLDLLCKDGTCRKAACENGAEGEVCRMNGCRGDLYCDSETNTCVKKATIGESCKTAICLEDLYCDTDELCSPMKE